MGGRRFKPDTGLKLIPQVPVHREKDIELPGGPAQEFAVLDPGPATLGDRSRLVPRQVPLQLPGQALIEKDAHR